MGESQNNMKNKPCFSHLINLAVILSFPLASGAQTPAPDNQHKNNQTATVQRDATTSYLDELASLPRWFQSIIPMLRNEGNELDREKLRDALRRINQKLASTEQMNLEVVGNLKSKTPDYGKLENQLTDIKTANREIAAQIGSIRSDLHLQGETEYERHATDAMGAKGILVDQMLNKLQYSKALSQRDQAALQSQSDSLVKLIRKAEDAVTAAYKTLEQSKTA